ncbi:GAF domain-containing protein [Labilibaculum sp. 44]|uniref:GAF domain-containing protein n=2 Tax=Labilibaculum euxinus TaxID=2686357 RepID=A0A425Y967_9BACT|nr:GAF domain-containing protein [Labilibaculum euxinus]MVB08176.1 GAF domain-containing protein [Labilibaculum euxinus]
MIFKRIEMNAIEKQYIDLNILLKWQEKIDLLEDLLKVSAILIMKLHPHELEVLVSSQNENNPYLIGDRGELSIGSYCDSVVAGKTKVHIKDAAEDDLWKDKMTYNSGMSCYLGMPICYPNEELFGTLCVLNKECREFDDLDHKLVDHFKESIESDLVIDEQNNIIRNSSIS